VVILWNHLKVESRNPGVGLGCVIDVIVLNFSSPWHCLDFKVFILARSATCNPPPPTGLHDDDDDDDEYLDI
jgi:hypothetical protein